MGPVSLLSACATTPNFAIAEIESRHEKLDGKRVRVTGWLRDCWYLSCHITAERGQKGPDLSLGASTLFDRAVGPFRKQEIEIEVEGIVGRPCFDHSNDPGRDPNLIEVCTDRADQLRRPRLLRVIQTFPKSDEEIN
jgi:hypothetical protein